MKEQLKMPRITLLANGRVVCEDIYGNAIVTLVNLRPGLCDPTFPCFARDELRIKGYRTDFAYWSERGRFRQFIKDIIV